jgi:copper(I)-binding protein
MRTSWPAVAAGLLVAALGAAGLIRGAQSQSPASTLVPAQIAVTDAYVRTLPHPAHSAAAYFTIFNTTSSDDRLLSVASGAGAKAMLELANAKGALQVPANGVVVHAHGSLVLGPKRGRVMIEGVYGTLKPGQNVDLELSFQNAGPIDVIAQVKR